MLANDAKVGAILWANVSGKRARVRIVSENAISKLGRTGRYSRRVYYRIAREFGVSVAGSPLTRLRTARELHFCAHRGAWAGLSEPTDTLAGACGDCAAEYSASVDAPRCGECGEFWPCSDTVRTDIRGDVRALHVVGERWRS